MWGNVRNRNVTAAIAAVPAALALYISWSLWIAAIFERGAGKHIRWARLAQHPSAVWSLMKWINQYGTWGLNSGEATKGWALWGIWALEGALVIGLGIGAAIAVVQYRPFCEACNRWCRRGARMFLAPPPDAQQLKLQLESNDLRPLQALGPGAKGGDHLVVNLHSCDQCRQFHTLSLTHVTIRRKKFGHPQISSKTIVRQLVVGPGEAQTLRQLSEQLAQSPKLAAERARGAAAGGQS